MAKITRLLITNQHDMIILAKTDWRIYNFYNFEWKKSLQFSYYITETPTAKARWVLKYLNFQYITNDIKTNLFL